MEPHIERLIQNFIDAANQLNHISDKHQQKGITTCAIEAEAAKNLLIQRVQSSKIDYHKLASLAANTNLLALNLAIEATRLGEEAGKDAALVAEKFRALAEEIRQRVPEEELQKYNASQPNETIGKAKNWFKRLLD
ncbi:MAG: methyl-accepting chemotaxis protein [Rufibacter sp.]